MYQVAIVDDNRSDAERVMAFLTRFSEEKQQNIVCTWHASADEFLSSYHMQYDIVFMDIRMQGTNGMEAAQKLREKDRTVILIFLTSLAQYAVQGYEVDAMAYIIKPVTYPALKMKMEKALGRCRKDVPDIVINEGGARVSVHADDLKYVEIFDHNIQYRTSSGIIKGYGTLKDVEAALPEHGFFRLNKQIIVNLKYVTRIEGKNATVDGQEFAISRQRKKEFLADYHLYGLNRRKGSD
ncbi:MAG: response regulator transcription factor [Clostridia bacterium]|nr:response regulator transcription factor [Clostridia bacterium]